MRILHLYKDYYPVLGGIENHVRMLAEAQARLGHDVSVLVTSRDAHSHVETLNGVRVVYAARLANVSSAPLSLDWIRLLRHERPDVAHLHFPYPPGEVAQLFSGRARRVVLTYHSDIVRQRFLRVVYAPLMKRVLARVDRIIATSPNYVATSPVLCGFRDKCVVIPLGIDPAPFLSTLASHPNTDRILFVGKLRYYKGVDYLLAALPEIRNAALRVVGTGPMESTWRRLADVLGVADRVEFRGQAPDEELPRLYADCDVFVLPASERSEAFGAVQLEAMASARPVVSTDVGTGVGWVNQNEVTGLVVPPRDPSGLSAAITRLLADRPLRERMGSAGRERVLDNFSLEVMVERIMQAYA